MKIVRYVSGQRELVDVDGLTDIGSKVIGLLEDRCFTTGRLNDSELPIWVILLGKDGSEYHLNYTQFEELDRDYLENLQRLSRSERSAADNLRTMINNYLFSNSDRLRLNIKAQEKFYEQLV